MKNSKELFEHLTGSEFFRPKSLRDLNFVFGDLVEEVSKKKVILVAGTNGKGETSLYIEWLIRKLGRNTALFTSPHLFSVHERFRINEKQISEEILMNNLKKFEDLYPNNSCKLSYFELCFWVFLKLVNDSDSEFVVCEVGLGGRLDITNMLSPVATVLTNVSRDHTEILGNTYKKILKEKLGITRPGVPLYSGASTNYLRSLIKKHCQEKEIPLSFVNVNSKFSVMNKNLGKMVLNDLVDNYSLDKKDEDLFKDHRVRKIKVLNSEIIFYGTHNLDGHRSLLKSFGPKKTFNGVILNFSNRPEKEIESILKLYINYLGIEGKVFVNTMPFFKSCCFEKLFHIIEKSFKSEVQIIKEESDLNRTLKKYPTFLWTGSYYSSEIINAFD